MATPSYTMAPLPPTQPVETTAVLKRLAEAHRYLAELKGVAATIPNERILVDTLSLQEAKDSSAIENIITTDDEVYRSDFLAKTFTTPAAKEVHRYAQALKLGFDEVRTASGIGLNTMLRVQATLEANGAGLRKLPGTVLKNDRTGEVVYTPPQDHATIVDLMNNLEAFLNKDELMDADPLVKMAIAHHQFESIHPFYDGNGRTGRILNILYLVRCGLLDLPILYMSRFIIRHKSEYYRLLQAVRADGNWEPWVLYMLEAIARTAQQTITLVKEIRALMQQYKQRIRSEQPRLYSQDLLNNLFRHPYTKIDLMMRDMEVTRLTATRYLNVLVGMGLLQKVKVGRTNFYLNEPLFELLRRGSSE
ncbi:MAG TPA: Fic family protein [Flavobacteriales bacterium]|nr:Fic family protein [Flavobacteriales bacterium]HQW87648.1 Fic family protein [Flavobacteriales bacterium]